MNHITRLAVITATLTATCMGLLTATGERVPLSTLKPSSLVQVGGETQASVPTVWLVPIDGQLVIKLRPEGAIYAATITSNTVVSFDFSNCPFVGAKGQWVTKLEVESPDYTITWPADAVPVVKKLPTHTTAPDQQIYVYWMAWKGRWVDGAHDANVTNLMCVVEGP